MVNALLGDLQCLVMLSGTAQRIGEIAHRGGEIPQFGRGFGVIGAGQKRLPRLPTGAFHQLFPEANGFPQDRNGLGGSPAVVQHSAQH